MIHIYLNISCSVSGTLPSGQLSAIPWRRSSVKYTNNEAYFDVIEEVDASKEHHLITHLPLHLHIFPFDFSY